MTTQKELNKINIFSSLDQYNSYKSNIGSDELSLVQKNILDVPATVTASTNVERITTSGSGIFSSVSTSISPAISAGTYEVSKLLQQLVSNSHYHNKKVSYYDCNCDCGDDGSCIIGGEILTDKGYIPIQELKAGDFIIYEDKRYEVKGIKTSTLGKRKAVSPDNVPGLVVTDDHLFYLGRCHDYNVGITYDLEGFCRESSKNLTDGKTWGTYARKDKCLFFETEKAGGAQAPSERLVEREGFDGDTVTYTPIVENCEWCVVNGCIIACARYVGEEDQ